MRTRPFRHGIFIPRRFTLTLVATRKDRVMADFIVGGVVSGLLLAYLVYALFKAEDI